MTTTRVHPMLQTACRCMACHREWCVFALHGRDAGVRSCPFCGLLRVRTGRVVTLVARELRGGVR